RLIGRLCKRGNALSRPVLMGRGLDGYFSLLACVQFSSVAGAARSRTISVAIARGKHLFPFRTEPLSLSAPMVLGGQPPGRVGRRRSYLRAAPRGGSLHGGAALQSLGRDPLRNPGAVVQWMWRTRREARRTPLAF